jgi:FkbM family methyltransferase
MEQKLKPTKFDTPSGVFYLSEDVDIKVTNHFRKYGGHSLDEIRNLEKLITPETIVFDVGAHVGTFSIPLSRKCKLVYSFEPNPINIELLKRNISENERKNIVLVTNAVAEKSGKVRFFAKPKSSGQSYVSNHGEGNEVDAITLDSLNVSPGLIKIDIEGYEVKALWGAEKILAKKPLLYIEYVLWCLRRAGSSTSELNKLLTQKGYRMYLHVEGNLFVSLPHLSFIVGKNQTSNVLCIPREMSLPKELETISLVSYYLGKIKAGERLRRIINSLKKKFGIDGSS